MQPIYIADEGNRQFETARLQVDIVCAGDSLTGWNNYGPVECWPFPTYPQFLQQTLSQAALQLADGGIAGEISDNGHGHVRRYLAMFPQARHFIIGFGTNDLGTWPDLKATSRRIIENLDRMIQYVRSDGKSSILMNVPNVNEALFPASLAADCRTRRDYHNAQLASYCEQNGLPLANIRSPLHDEHFGDEVHPNAAGARLIAQAVFDVLASVLSRRR